MWNKLEHIEHIIQYSIITYVTILYHGLCYNDMSHYWQAILCTEQTELYRST